MTNVQDRGFKRCVNTELTGVLVHGFREVGDIVVWIVDERRVIIGGSIPVELLGLVTCEVRQDRVDRNVSEVVVVGKGLEVTVKEQEEQGRVKHEKGKSEMTKR